MTGDIHSAWACDLPYDAATYPIGDSAGVEFVCTSVTSNNLDDITGAPPRTASLTVEAAIQTSNRHVRYLNFDDHGYSVLDVTPARRPDGLLRHRRPGGPQRTGRVGHVLGDPVRHQQGHARRPARRRRRGGNDV